MGVSPPDEAAFRAAVGNEIVSSPTEGVIVLEALPGPDEPVVDDEKIEEAPRPKKRKKAEKAGESPEE
jgi:hypothetical protein